MILEGTAFLQRDAGFTLVEGVGWWLSSGERTEPTGLRFTAYRLRDATAVWQPAPVQHHRHPPAQRAGAVRVRHRHYRPSQPACRRWAAAQRKGERDQPAPTCIRDPLRPPASAMRGCSLVALAAAAVAVALSAEPGSAAAVNARATGMHAAEEDGGELPPRRIPFAWRRRAGFPRGG